MPGPPPKRSDQRRRRNKRDVDKATVHGAVKPPGARAGWHPIARRWYRSLRDSGQAQFYEPSDWAAAQYVAEVMSRHLQVELENEKTGEKVKLQRSTPGAQLFSGIWAAMNDLLTTEAARRRMRLEVERPDGDTDTDDAAVTEIDEYRRRIESR